MPEDPNADVMKLKVREVRNVAINGGVAPIAFRFCIEKFPATLGGVIYGVPVTGNKVIEGRIKREERPLVRGNRAYQSQTRWIVPEYALEFLFVFSDRPERGNGRLQTGLAHFTRIGNRHSSLILKRLGPTVPELLLVVDRVQYGRHIALPYHPLHTHRCGPSVGKCPLRIVTGSTSHGSVCR